MADLIGKLIILATSVGVIVAVSVLLYIVHRRLLAMYADKPTRAHHRQLLMLAAVVVGVVLAVILMPIGNAMRGQLLGLLGILLSATIALSSTTLVGNAMAGLTLRTFGNFKPGDYIKVGEYYGRVTVMDLLHTEIQTEDRDLATLPNLFLVTHPVTVQQASGTLINVEVSLGYDVPRTKVERLLMLAAESAELEKPFVQIRHLGDFSVVYRVVGLLTEPKGLIGARRRLRAMVLDALHGGGVEIVSPNFMNTRSLDAGRPVIPDQVGAPTPSVRGTGDPDSVIFDKAQKAESLEQLRSQAEEIRQRIATVDQQLEDMSPEDDNRRSAVVEKKKLEGKLQRVEKLIQGGEEQLNS